ncbi:uncharacterized protein LOC143245491 [Tachypleus tridentatus]|uniref:uncharacterized protein LOC143245491 n=1 Tax=Tachypleus tridentatus TaxID=6853 RepID=UPI003FCFE14F
MVLRCPQSRLYTRCMFYSMLVLSSSTLFTVFNIKNHPTEPTEINIKPTQTEYINKSPVDYSRLFTFNPQNSSQISSDNSQFSHTHVNNLPTTDWIQVRRGLFVYSAFWDDRKNVKNGPFIRIFGVFSQSLTKIEKEEYFFGLTCLLRSNGSVFPGVATMYDMDDPYDKNLYVVISCFPYIETSIVPKNVAILYHNSSDVPNWMPVTSFPGKSLMSKGRIAACIKPLYGPFTNKDLLAQFLAYYTIIGVNHFISTTVYLP